MAEIIPLNVEMSRKSPPELSIESKMLITRLQQATVEEIISYESMSNLIGRDVRAEGRGNLNTARAHVLRDQSINFGTVVKVGIKRLRDDETVKGGRALQRIKRISNRRRRELLSVDYPNLNKELQVSHNTELTQLGTIGFFTKDQTAKVISGHVDRSELPIGKTLEFFGKNS